QGNLAIEYFRHLNSPDVPFPAIHQPGLVGQLFTHVHRMSNILRTGAVGTLSTQAIAYPVPNQCRRAADSTMQTSRRRESSPPLLKIGEAQEGR
ncbi:MAG: hypothetical protein KGL44_13215, partial [Sphingomonadales bacterium]|nr:hypothetical protein [Sphingomonadales bacterium]